MSQFDLSDWELRELKSQNITDAELEDLYKQYTDNLATEPLTEKAVVGSIEYDGKIIILQGVRSAAKDTILFMEII